MDYLEGFLVGPVWSDTDYRTRRHFNAHVLLAALMAVAFVFLILFPPYYPKVVRVDWPLSWILLLLLTLLTPALSILYRRLPLFVRPLLLLIYAAKYLLLFYLLVQIFLPLVTFEKESILSLLYERVDEHIGTALEVIAESGGILATVAGVVAGGLWVLGEGLLLVLILILVPLLSIALYKLLQYSFDRLTKNFLDRQLDGINYYVPKKPVEPDLTVESPDPFHDTLMVSSPPKAEATSPPSPPPPLPLEAAPVSFRGQEAVREPARRIPLADKLPAAKTAAPRQKPLKRDRRAGFNRFLGNLKRKSKRLAASLVSLVSKAGRTIKAWALTFWAFLGKTAKQVKEGIARVSGKGPRDQAKGHDIRQARIKMPPDREESSDQDRL